MLRVRSGVQSLMVTDLSTAAVQVVNPAIVISVGLSYVTIIKPNLADPASKDLPKAPPSLQEVRETTWNHPYNTTKL